MFFKKLVPLLMFLITLLIVISCSPIKPSVEETVLNSTSTNPSKLTNGEEPSSSSPSETLLTTQRLNIIPLEFKETTELYIPPFPAAGTGSLMYNTAEPGWKFVNIRIAFENPSNSFVTVCPWDTIPDIKLKTEQNWSYDIYDRDTSSLLGIETVFLPFWQNNKAKNITGRFQIPGGFRISGDHLFKFGNIDSSQEFYYLIFKVAEKSSGYILSIPTYPGIKIDNNLTGVVFPTSLSDNSFNKIGEQLNISDKGTIKILGFTRGNDSGKASLQIELSNASGGYDQEFNLGFIFVGDDGIFRCQEAEQSFNLPNLDFPRSITVGPGQSKNLTVNPHIPDNVSNIKLIITGDISSVINLE